MEQKLLPPYRAPSMLCPCLDCEVARTRLSVRTFRGNHGFNRWARTVTDRKLICTVVYNSRT